MIVKLNYNRMCSSKNKYTSRFKANIRGLAEIKLKRAINLYTYKCPICGGWHLTHNSTNMGSEKYKVKFIKSKKYKEKCKKS